MRVITWRGPSRGGFLLLVLLAHVLLAVLLTVAMQRQARFTRAPATHPAKPLLWLQPAPTPPVSMRPVPPGTAPPQAPRRLEAEPSPRRLAQPSAAAVEPQPITIATPPSEGKAATLSDGSAASAPLDLRLPPQRASEPLPAAALTRGDPRVREQLSYGERMARSIGTDNSLHEEALPDGSRRFSKGTGCVIARPSRISELDAFNNSASPKPRSIGAC